MANYQKLFLKMIVSAVSELSKDTPSDANEHPPSKGKAKPAAPTSGVATPRRICGGVAAVFLILAAAIYSTGIVRQWTGSESTSHFLVSSLTRIGLVFGALWLAWDSLKRPARWLPPGLAVLGVLALVLVAAQPKLIFVILPLVGVLTVFTSLLRVFRRK